MVYGTFVARWLSTSRGELVPSGQESIDLLAGYATLVDRNEI